MELVKRLLADTKCKTLKDFLRVEFSNVSADIAGASGLWVLLQPATQPHQHLALVADVTTVAVSM